MAVVLDPDAVVLAIAAEGSRLVAEWVEVGRVEEGRVEVVELVEAGD